MFCGQCLWWAMPPNKNHGSAWNTIWVSTDRMNLCQTHYKQVPDFSRAPESGQGHMVRLDQSQASEINSQYNWLSPVPAFGSTWVVLLLLFFRSAPSTFPNKRVHFRESLVIRFYSEIDQIHLSNEAQCVIACLPLGDCHNTLKMHACHVRIGLHAV